jgi:hypothetical protein
MTQVRFGVMKPKATFATGWLTSVTSARSSRTKGSFRMQQKIGSSNGAAPAQMVSRAVRAPGLTGEYAMLSGRWNIWATGILIALLADAAVAAFAIWATHSIPIVGLLFTCVIGFLAGLGIATVRNWFVDRP